MSETGGDLRAVEKALGLDQDYLSGPDTMIEEIKGKDINGLRMASGKEGEANSHWIPGGFTSGGIPERSWTSHVSLLLRKFL